MKTGAFSHCIHLDQQYANYFLIIAVQIAFYDVFVKLLPLKMWMKLFIKQQTFIDKNFLLSKWKVV